MIFLINSFFAALFDVRAPLDVAGHPVVYVPVGVAMTLFAIALGVLLLFRETLSKTIRFLIAGVLTFVGMVLILWGIFVLFISFL